VDRLSNAERAFVEEPKLGYLLRVEEKGGFFEAIGFSVRDPDALRRSLLEHAREGTVVHTLGTPFGVKRDPETRSVWILEHGSDRPRFLTAYPR
jgi:hypothetical protein